MTPTSATAADYLWFAERYPDLTDGYCFTLVEGLTPGEALRRAGAEETGSLSGVAAICEVSYDTWDEYDGDRLFVAATTVGDGWVLLVEANGFLGNLPEQQRALSEGTRFVSHFSNIGTGERFHWIEDGRLRLRFEFPWEGEGSDAEAAAAVMRAAGFVPDEDDERSNRLRREAAFALAERLTGVRLTPELLETAEYTGGLVTLR